MSKAAAIHIALITQLAADGKADLGLKDCLGPEEAPNPDNQPYNAGTVLGFLANIAIRLRADTPSLTFHWSKLDPKVCLRSALWVVESQIAENTEVAPASRPPGDGG